MPVEFDDAETFGDDLGAAMRAAADTFQPADTRGLVHDGHTRGRRLRRRRTAMVTAAVAAFAVAGAGGAVAGLGGGSGGGSGVASAPQRPAVQGKPTARSAAAAAHHKPLTAHQVEAVLIGLLPKKGQVSGVTGRGTEEGIPYAHVVYDDGHGKAAVEAYAQAEGQAPECPSPNPDPLTSCSLTHVRGGTLMIYKGFEYPDHRVETKDWSAVFVTASGAQVGVSEWNSPQEKDAPITRPEPPLTAVQLTAVVTAPAWRKVIDALPAPHDGKVPGGDGKLVGTAKP